jgi:hypothetical protein
MTRLRRWAGKGEVGDGLGRGVVMWLRLLWLSGLCSCAWCGRRGNGARIHAAKHEVSRRRGKGAVEWEAARRKDLLSTKRGLGSDWSLTVTRCGVGVGVGVDVRSRQGNEQKKEGWSRDTEAVCM